MSSGCCTRGLSRARRLQSSARDPVQHGHPVVRDLPGRSCCISRCVRHGGSTPDFGPEPARPPHGDLRSCPHRRRLIPAMVCRGLLGFALIPNGTTVPPAGAMDATSNSPHSRGPSCAAPRPTCGTALRSARRRPLRWFESTEESVGLHPSPPDMTGMPVWGGAWRTNTSGAWCLSSRSCPTCRPISGETNEH